jgi:Arc/MetJ family transcription regulator
MGDPALSVLIWLACTVGPGVANQAGERYGYTISSIWETRMKTTIELPDELIEQARRVARQERATLRALVEEGLQRSLEARRQAVRRQLDFPSYGGSGLTEEFQGASWSRIRDEIYRERGA